ncbi:MAG: PorV/PorQ family protein, partial [bacterium]
MKVFFIGASLLILMVTSVNSQQREQFFPGARPLGLGETFVAIADDGNAIYWNPAGLPYLKREELNFMYSNLYGINIKNLYFCYTHPLFRKLAFGVDWLRYGFDDDELSFGRNHWNLSFGYAFNNSLAFGSNLKYLKTDTKLKGTSLWDANAWGWGMDFGVLVSHQFKDVNFLKELRAGMMLHDATDTWIRFDTGTREKILPRNLRIGFSYKPFETISWKWLSFHEPIIALDFDDRIHIGSETWFLRDLLPLALRGGVQKDRYTDEGLTWSAGFSIQKDFFRIDYAYTIPPILPNTHRFSLSLIYNFNPHLVEITKVDVEPVFSSLIRHYNRPKRNIGKVFVRNKHNVPLDEAKVSFKVKDYTQATCWQGRLDTGLVTPVDLMVNLSDAILKVDETEKSLTGEVEVTYSIRNRQYQEKAPVRFFLYGNRAIRWDEPGRAVAFITQEDSLVRSFATAVRQYYEIDLANWFLKREMADAVKIYEALRVYGIEPTPDPNATYSSATTKGFYID